MSDPLRPTPAAWNSEARSVQDSARPSTDQPTPPPVLWMAMAAGILLVGYAWAFLPDGIPRGMAWLFIAATVGMMVALMALGARSGTIHRRGLGWILLGTCVLLSSIFALAFLLPPGLDPVSGEMATLWWGLPPRAAVVIYGAGILPLFIIPVAYAWAFPR